MKKLLLTASYLAAAIFVAGMAPQSASAQQRVYDRNGNLVNMLVKHNDGTGTDSAGSRYIRTGNTVRTYDSSGRLTLTSVRHGNVMRSYNSKGRLVARGVFGPNGARVYDTRGHFVASNPSAR
jgi:hypothetical protein